MKNPLCNFASEEGGRETAFCAILPNQMQPSHFSALHSACTHQTSKSRELEGRRRSRAAFHSTTALPFLQSQPCTTPYFGLGAEVPPLPTGMGSSSARIPQLPRQELCTRVCTRVKLGAHCSLQITSPRTVPCPCVTRAVQTTSWHSPRLCCLDSWP